MMTKYVRETLLKIVRQRERVAKAKLAPWPRNARRNSSSSWPGCTVSTRIRPWERAMKDAEARRQHECCTNEETE
jgi:hypothetical protein